MMIEEEGPFVCGHCHEKKWARAAAEGRGSALELIRLASCPDCARRDPHAERAFRKTTLLRAVAALAVTFGIVALVSLVVLFTGVLYYKALLLSGAGIIMFFVVLQQRGHALRNVDRIVQFYNWMPSDAPYVGMPCMSCRQEIVAAADGIRCNRCGAALHGSQCAQTHAARVHV